MFLNIKHILKVRWRFLCVCVPIEREKIRFKEKKTNYFYWKEAIGRRSNYVIRSSTILIFLSFSVQSSHFVSPFFFIFERGVRGDAVIFPLSQPLETFF